MKKKKCEVDDLDTHALSDLRNEYIKRNFFISV